eukprot:jgi/Botrbrau1/11624/Bobra.0209s0015.1
MRACFSTSWGCWEKCAALRALDFSGAAYFLTDERLRAMLAVCGSRLYSLKLDNCAGLTHAGLHAVGQLAPCLQELSVQSMSEVVGCGCELLLLRGLTSLDASWCRQLSADALRSLGPRLRRLSLRGCELVRDAGLEGLLEVEHLDITCTAIGDAGLQALAQSAGKLKHLVISPLTYNIWPPIYWTKDGLTAFQEARPDVLIQLAIC